MPTATITKTEISNNNQNALMDRIRQGVIGKDSQITTPFGVGTLTYADYTASGRSLNFIEDAIRQ